MVPPARSGGLWWKMPAFAMGAVLAYLLSEGPVCAVAFYWPAMAPVCEFVYWPVEDVVRRFPEEQREIRERYLRAWVFGPNAF